MTHFLSNWQKNGDNIALLIGGADGLSKSVNNTAHQLWGVVKFNIATRICKTDGSGANLSCSFIAY